MMNKHSISAFVIILSLCLVVVAKDNKCEAEPLPQPEAYQQRMVDWLRSSENGYFHPSVVWKRVGQDGPYAMHTTKDIAKGETLMVLPRNYVIDSFETNNVCVTVTRMLLEYEKGDESFFAPYLSYLFDEGGTSTGLLPTAWTEEGRELLNYLLGHTDYEGEELDEKNQLEPRAYGRDSVFDVCGESFLGRTLLHPLKDDHLRQQAEDAYIFWMSRSWLDKILPVLDMYNHGNGIYKNVELTEVHFTDDDITSYALRDIQAGEQLQISYSECMCEDCDYGGIRYTFNTQRIFVDYGFLEYYPRRWSLGHENEVIAEVDIDVDGKKSFKWIFTTPSQKIIQWISNQLQRLHMINEEFHEEVSEHKNTSSDAFASHHNIEHEANTLLELYEGYIEVLELALEHKDDPIGVTKEQFDKELELARQGSRYYELYS